MPPRRRSRTRSIDVADGQPLIGIPMVVNGRAIVRYFTSEEDADAATAQSHVRDASSLMGAWADLDDSDNGDEMLDALDRIRHDSKPTPPLEDI